jgi:exonuclease SbcC
MAFVDIIKSWFGKHEKTAPNPVNTAKAKPTPQKTNIKNKPSEAEAKKAIQANTTPSTPHSENTQLALINNPQTTFSIQEISLKKITDPTQLADIALTHKVAKIRQQAATQLQDPHLISQIANKAKHSDKGVYRILRQKLDYHAKQQQHANDYQHKLTQLCLDLEHHLQAAHTPLFAAKVQSLQQQWQQLYHTKETTHLALQQRFEAALAQAQQKISAEQTQKALHEQQQQTAKGFAQLAQDVLQINDNQSLTDFSSKLNALLFDWQYCTQHATIDAPLAQVVQKQQATLQQYSDLFALVSPQLVQMQELQQQLEVFPINQQAYDSLNTLLQSSTLFSTALPLPLLFTAIIDSLNTAQQALAAHQKAQQKAAINEAVAPIAKAQPSHPELEKLLAQINDALNQGHSKEADKILRNAQKYAKAHHLFDARLGEYLEKLQQMKEWAGFVVLPKKQELLAQMKQLAAQATETEPLTLFDKIKALQAQWQGLGTVHNDTEKALWEEFKQLGQVAYQPCQHYFEAQNAIYEQNAAARQQLCLELQHYLDNLPSTVNWQGHIEIIKKARADWQTYLPIDIKKHKELQATFNKIIKNLEDKLQAEYTHQAALKKELIDKMAQLLTHENIFDACQHAKELQHTWKTLGFCGHQQEHTLWQAFKQQCDALFSKREAYKEAQKAQEQLNVQLAEHLLDELHHQINTPTVASNVHKIEALQAEFSKLFLPKALNHTLRKRFNELSQQWQHHNKNQQQRQQQAQIKQIETAFELCVTAENSRLAGESVSLSLALAWQGLVTPPPFKTVLQKRWQAISSLKAAPLEEQYARAKTAFDACLLLELLLDINSPDNDNAARTAKKMALFEQQAYPKTEAETHALISQTLQQLLLLSGLDNSANTRIKPRLHAILQSPILCQLL